MRRTPPPSSPRPTRSATGVERADGRRVLVLGGDCTVELGVVAAAGPAGLVYFDMHPDLNTPETIPGGTLDWMGVAHLLGLPGTHPDVAAVARIAPGDLVLLAADEEQMTAGERQAISRLQAVPMADVAADPAGAAARALALLGHDRLLVHFDVDVVDFTDLPLSENTGHNIGLPFAAARAVLEVLLADRRVAALTVTQHNPLHGAQDGSTTAALAEALAAVACA